jgi:23S rRNA pseudouridine2605 synthase
MNVATEGGSIRLNLFLARIGIASRRASDALIAAGRVRVDGRVVREMGTRVDPRKEIIAVDGRRIGAPPRRLVLLLHKPRGVVSTASDPEGRPTVVDLCRPFSPRSRLFPVGRLDVNTTGALLVTNDGWLCYRLTHPRFGIQRVYQVRVRGEVDEARVRRLERMAREDTRVSPLGGAAPRKRASVERVSRTEKEAVLRITLCEGRNRQVRRMCEAVGLRVVALKRVSFGPVSVRGLSPGAVRPLDHREIERLETAAGGEVG